MCLNKVLPKSNKRSNQEKKLKDGGNLKIPQKIPWKIVFPLIFPFFVFPLSFPSEGRFSPRRGIIPRSGNTVSYPMFLKTLSMRLRSVVVPSRTRNREIEGSIRPDAVAVH